MEEKDKAPCGVDLNAVIRWRIETYDQIRHMERTNWQVLSIISTLTIALIVFIREFSLLVFWALLFLTALNLLGLHMLFRNRRLFLQKVYIGAITEKVLAKYSRAFEEIMRERPDEWTVEKAPIFREVFPLGSFFMAMVSVYGLILFTVHLWAFILICLYLSGPHPEINWFSLLLDPLFLPVYISAAITTAIVIAIAWSFRSWWWGQKWVRKKA